MGHRKRSYPVHGSRAYSPRVRARRESARWRSWPVKREKVGEPALQGFAGYKVGMTHVIYEENRKRHRLYKQERVMAATIVEIPKITIFGVRAYKKGYRCHNAFAEVWTDRFNRHLRRTIHTPVKKAEERKWTMEKMKAAVDQMTDVRVLAHTNPSEAGLPKKRPDVLEIPINGGTVPQRLDFAFSLIEKAEINFKDYFKESQYVDVTATTTGRGFQGVVKRWGVKIAPRKKRKGRRVVGCIGSFHPNKTGWHVPRASKHGYHPRTEYNKLVLKISDLGREITPDSGFGRYGIVRSNYILLKGSVPGPKKRLIRIRYPIRRSADLDKDEDPVKIAMVSASYRKRKTTTEA